MAGHTYTASRLSYERRWANLVRAIALEVKRYRPDASDREHEAGARRARLLEAQARALAAEARGRDA